VGDEAVLLVRQGADVFAIGAECTHYHGPLAEGVVADGVCGALASCLLRCPHRRGRCTRRRSARWHAGRSSSKAAPSSCATRSSSRSRARAASRRAPDKIVIVGGGAAGFAAAEMLRRQDYDGSIVMLSNDDAPPVDRPNLSKDYLAGSAPEDWLPLRPDDFLQREPHRSAAQDGCREDRSAAAP
jgi:hypothetical protein